MQTLLKLEVAKHNMLPGTTSKKMEPQQNSAAFVTTVVPEFSVKSIVEFLNDLSGNALRM